LTGELTDIVGKYDEILDMGSISIFANKIRIE
jgi:hypothetical protein